MLEVEEEGGGVVEGRKEGVEKVGPGASVDVIMLRATCICSRGSGRDETGDDQRDREREIQCVD